MATAPLLNDKQIANGDDDMNLEIFCVIWLDASINAKDIRKVEQKLNPIINRLKKFQDAEQCNKYIEQRSKNDRLIMVVSGQLGQAVVPSIHKFRQIMSIYVYCNDKKTNEQWAYKFPKVKAVVMDLNELISRVEIDHKIQKIIEEPVSINFFSVVAGKSTIGLNREFVFSQVLIDRLLRLKSTVKDFDELIEIFKKYYQGNTVELKNLKKFQKNYSSQKALWWYTQQSFFSKTLDTALCKQDTHMTFLFRAFIADIQCQLKKSQTTDRLRVFRCQIISTEELNNLNEHCGQFISMNSFFFASTDYRQALSLIDSSKPIDNLEAVLFEIDANPKTVNLKPFANISAHSEFRDQSEVVFMMGSIFRLNSIERHSDGRKWIIQMTLCGDDEPEFKQVIEDMKHELGSEDINFQNLGKLLRMMGKLDLAEQYLTRLLNDTPPNDPLIGELYRDLAELASHAGDYDKSIHWYQRAIGFKGKSKQVGFIFGHPISSKSVVIPNIPANARWSKNGVTVAGGNKYGRDTNQLHSPHGLCVDDDRAIFIADHWNHRIILWKKGDSNGHVVAGGNGQGTRLDELDRPTDVLIDKETDSLIVCNEGRVVRWSRRGGATQGEILIDNIDCCGLAMDDQRNLYVSDTRKHEVQRYKIGNKDGTLVAGGNGKGTDLNQLNEPRYICVDQQQTVYVSDEYNDRIMKWYKGATEGVVVAGGQGSYRSQLSHPRGIFVDTLGTLYIVDSSNKHVLRWPQDATQGTVIVGGNGYGSAANQLALPEGLSFDRHGNLYVVDRGNQRVQRFSME